jgi:hypothetical protein
MTVSERGYYGWRKRKEKPPTLKGKSLAELVRSSYGREPAALWNARDQKGFS